MAKDVGLGASAGVEDDVWGSDGGSCDGTEVGWDRCGDEDEDKGGLECEEEAEGRGGNGCIRDESKLGSEVGWGQD